MHSISTAHNTPHRAGPIKWHREYSIWPSRWRHVQALPMIFCAWDYRSGPIFRCRSQCDVKTPSDSVFEAAVHKQRNVVQYPSASTCTESNFLASESVPWLWGVSKWLFKSLPMILPILLAFGTSLQWVIPPIRHAMPVFDIKITGLEALKPLTTRSFTKSSLTVITYEHSTSLSRSFLQIKAENPNFPQTTWIWLESWHLQTKIDLMCKHKFTNVVLSLCWQMYRLTVWHFWSAYFDQHLPLKLSIEKRRKQNCRPNRFTEVIAIALLLGHELEEVFHYTWKIWPPMGLVAFQY